MNMIRLQSGNFVQDDAQPKENAKYLDKKAMLVYCGNFDSMDGPVEITDDHISKLADSHNSFLSKLAHLATGDVPLKNCPPIQLDHSTSARDTVGRLVGNLEVADFDDDGKKVKALFGNVRIMGQENMEKILDGRWTHLSIGADLESGKISELTITPFPAAPNASLLSKAGNKFKGETMFEKLMAFLTGTKRMAEGDAEKELAKMSDAEKAKMSEDAEKHEKMKKHLMDKEKMSAEDAEKKLSEMDDESKAKMSGEMDSSKDEGKEPKDKLAEEKKEDKKDEDDKEEKEKKAKMTAARSSLAKLSSNMTAKFDGAKLAAKKTGITARLSRLQATASITPAEIKKIDIAALAAKSDETVEEVLKSYENRQPVIMTGLHGSTKGVNPGKTYKDVKLAKMQKEILSSMPFTSKARLAGEYTVGTESVVAPVEPAAEAAVEADVDQMLAEAMTMLDEGKIAEAKEHLKKLVEVCKSHIGVDEAESVSIESTQAQMSALTDSLKELQSEFVSYQKLVGQVVGE